MMREHGISARVPIAAVTLIGVKGSSAIAPAGGALVTYGGLSCCTRACSTEVQDK